MKKGILFLPLVFILLSVSCPYCPPNSIGNFPRYSAIIMEPFSTQNPYPMAPGDSIGIQLSEDIDLSTLKISVPVKKGDLDPEIIQYDVTSIFYPRPFTPGSYIKASTVDLPKSSSITAQAKFKTIPENEPNTYTSCTRYPSNCKIIINDNKALKLRIGETQKIRVSFWNEIGTDNKTPVKSKKKNVSLNYRFVAGKIIVGRAPG